MDIQLEKKKGLRPKHYGYIALGAYCFLWDGNLLLEVQNRPIEQKRPFINCFGH